MQPETTPRELRESMNWTLREAVERLNKSMEKQEFPGKPLSYGTLDHVETDGTENIKVIRAFADVYSLTLEETERMMDAVRSCRKILQKIPVLA